GFVPTNYVCEEGNDSTVLDEESGSVDFQDDEYFDSYATLTIHHEMISDKARTDAYRDGIELVKDKIKDKVVLDVGCGSGILSLFCARAGAKHVYAVDASDIIERARRVAKANGYENTITFIQGKIEHLDLPVDKVDVIVSEWMGTMLICESMITSVLVARERFLRPGGLMLPGRSRLLVAPHTQQRMFQERIEFWNDVYGFDMSCLKEEAKETYFHRPDFKRVIPADEILGDKVPALVLDMHTATEADLEQQGRSVSMRVTKPGVMHGLLAWFDVDFACQRIEHEDDVSENAVTLDTSPRHMPTHWRQVAFTFAHEAPISVEEGDEVHAEIEFRRNRKWRRHYEVSLSLRTVLHSQGGTEITWPAKVFPAWQY
ncbi:MAG: hypothetical protein MHM6MM_006024, partial [Cercozoa sp. M6MM]